MSQSASFLVRFSLEESGFAGKKNVTTPMSPAVHGRIKPMAMKANKNKHVVQFLFFILAVTLSESVVYGQQTYYVSYAQGKYSVHEGEPTPNWIAQGVFTDTTNSTGWSYLWLQTNPAANDSQQAYAAGLLEATLTSPLISLSGMNTWSDFCQKKTSVKCSKLTAFFKANLHWMMSQVMKMSDKDPFWHMVNMYLQQLKGLQDGFYKKRVGLQMLDIYWLQFASDLGDISLALDLPEKKPIRGGSCSAMVKVLDDNKDLYVAHDTWNHYSSMLRVLKSYDFAFHILPNAKYIIPGKKITFSSYPGLLYSGDDYYLLSSGMASMETTIENNNKKIAKRNTVPNGCVLEGIRAMVANRIATNGPQWAKIFSAYNSGTYNNQWMVVDYNLFTPSQTLPEDGLLIVLEQLPGYIKYEDLTPKLKAEKYWGSYNTPYFPEVVERSKQQDMINQYGDLFTYENAPRAKIMHRDQGNVTDMKSMIKLMRYNDFTHDPLSKCNCTPSGNAELAISARSDLNPINGSYPQSFLGHRPHGGTDMKLTNSSLARDLQFVAIAGPTYDQVTPFQWSKSDFKNTVSHIGHPDIFKFEPYIFGDDVMKFE